MLNYTLIEALAAVVFEGGFEKAAGLLHITQSAVSQRIRLLEDDMGQVLLVRGKPPVPTAAGRQVLKHFRQVERLESDLKASVDVSATDGFTSIALGVNADSLSLWLVPALKDFLINERVVLDLKVDDQEQTLKRLRDGEVLGCISTRETPMQGCRARLLGTLTYRLLGSPAFAEHWFSEGLTEQAVMRAPHVIFSRDDELQHMMLKKIFGHVPATLHVHYIPSTEKFLDMMCLGLGFGMIPDQQGRNAINKGELIDLAPGFQVDTPLYWHCWNLKSGLLDRLTTALCKQAARAFTGTRDPMPEISNDNETD